MTVDIVVNAANAAVAVQPEGPGKASATLTMNGQAVGAFSSPEHAALFARAPNLREALDELLTALVLGAKVEDEEALERVQKRLNGAMKKAADVCRSHDELMEKSRNLPPPSRIIRGLHS